MSPLLLGPLLLLSEAWAGCELLAHLLTGHSAEGKCFEYLLLVTVPGALYALPHLILKTTHEMCTITISI